MSARALSSQRWALGVWMRALGLATIAHLILPDYDQSGWATPRALGWISALILLVTPARAVRSLYRMPRALWITACLTLAMTKLYTLLALRDVLTQSVLLMFFYILGALGLAYPHLAGRCARAAVWCTSLTYLLAILHKLNYDFLETPQSCAIHGVEISLSLIGDVSALTPLTHALASLAAAHPTLTALTVISLEATIAALCLAHSRWVWPLGVAFHLPLTLTIAPAFGSVCAVGWGAGRLLNDSRPRRLWTRTYIPYALYTSGVKRRTQPTLASSWVVWIPLLYGAHGALSPYVGVEVQHSAAMLSNLRVDAACANSVVMPRLGAAPYIEITEIHWGERELKERARRTRATLWNLAALHTMQRNWCIPENRPLLIKGRRHSDTPDMYEFIIPDLCSVGALNTLDIDTWFPAGWQRFQKNLSRDCHAPCVH